MVYNIIELNKRSVLDWTNWFNLREKTRNKISPKEIRNHYVHLWIDLLLSLMTFSWPTQCILHLGVFLNSLYIDPLRKYGRALHTGYSTHSYQGKLTPKTLNKDDFLFLYLLCVWMRWFKKIIYLFEKFEVFSWKIDMVDKKN